MSEHDSYHHDDTPDWVTMEPSPALVSEESASASPVSFRRVAEEIGAWVRTLSSAAVYATLIVTFGFQIARVDGSSMEPTLHNSDRLIVNKLGYRFADPQVGDIVMLLFPKNPDMTFVKRIVGIPGDTIRIDGGRVYRNSVALPDEFIPAEDRSTDSRPSEVVPEGFYFVLGDHRNNSSDSRDWGYVPKKYILGKVSVRWWPLDRAELFSGFNRNHE